MIKKQSKDPKTQRLIIPRNYTFFIFALSPARTVVIWSDF